MSEPLPNKTEYTREEYLALEDQADYKSEYHQGEIFAMAGGSRNHSVICVNVIRRLSEAVDDKDCSQDSPTVERFFKQAKNRWLYSVSNGLDGRVAIQSVGCELSLDHIYRKVAFDDVNKNHRPQQR